MALDMSYQAIPHDCPLIELAASDSELGELLGFLPAWYRGFGTRPPNDDVAACSFWEMAQALNQANPGLAKRNLVLNRKWDVLHFLLSSNRRGDPGGHTDVLMDRAVRGVSAWPAHVRGTQGVPVRYVDPVNVIDIATHLAQLTQDDLRRHFCPAKFEAAAVYKADAMGADGTWVASCYEGFKSFYTEVAAHQEAVLVCLD